MTVNGARDGFRRDDLRAVAASAGMRPRRAESIIDEVQAAVTWWPEFAEGAGVDATQMADIGRHHRLALL